MSEVEPEVVKEDHVRPVDDVFMVPDVAQEKCDLGGNTTRHAYLQNAIKPLSPPDVEKARARVRVRVRKVGGD